MGVFAERKPLEVTMDEVDSSLTKGSGPEDRKAAAELTSGLSPENKKDRAIEVVGELSAESNKDLATAAGGNLGVEGKKDVAAELASDFSRKERAELIQRLRPTQPVTDFVWRVVIGSFAIVFVGTSAALVLAAFSETENIQILLTVVTTIAGFLAGFLSGKSDG